MQLSTQYNNPVKRLNFWRCAESSEKCNEWKVSGYADIISVFLAFIDELIIYIGLYGSVSLQGTDNLMSSTVAGKHLIPRRLLSNLQRNSYIEVLALRIGKLPTKVTCS